MKCPECKGNGRFQGIVDHAMWCPTCRGKGQIDEMKHETTIQRFGIRFGREDSEHVIIHATVDDVWIAKFDLTNEEWQRVVDALGGNSVSR